MTQDSRRAEIGQKILDLLAGLPHDLAPEILRDIAAMSAVPVHPVRVKPLTWAEEAFVTTDDDNGPQEGMPRKLRAWRSGYLIIRQSGPHGWFILRGTSDGVGHVFNTLEAAQAAAQADCAAIEPAPAYQPSTVAALWRANGQPDPHGTRYNCERATLLKGDMSDDELANRIFIADRADLDLIVWQTAAKDRIRWLSRALESATAAPTLAEA